MKKILTLVLVFIFALSSVSFAAVSSSRKSVSSPSVGSSIPKGVPSQQAAPSNQGSNYKPSAPASSYSDKAPASQANPSIHQQTQQQTSGGFLRNAGMFAGGMLMGSMLSNMLGFGSMGSFASIFGIIFNIIIIAAVIMGIRFLWDRFRNKKKDM